MEIGILRIRNKAKGEWREASLSSLSHKASQGALFDRWLMSSLQFITFAMP